jgi:ssDNA-binding Zn-finger/Zn-ribbon topoisomerase 1
MSIDKTNTFDYMRKALMNLDPVSWVQTHLTIDGAPFKLIGNGYKPFVDIYRYIAIKALEKNSKPVVILKSRQTGGTTMASALEMYFMGSGIFGTGGRPPMRVIHAFPQLEMAAVYSKAKLDEMISQSITDIDDKLKPGAKPKSYMEKLLDKGDTANSQSFKKFSDGNHLWIDSTGLTGDRLRGRTADVIFFDEVQDITVDAISNCTKILNQAQYGATSQGVQIYFGTPKKKGSNFYNMWQKSNQQYYHLGCENCLKHFPLYEPDSESWETTWVDGHIVKCTECGHNQDKIAATERGKWVGNKSEEDCDFIGFHVNQIYMPKPTKDDVLRQKPGRHVSNSERTYQNEVLGEFYQGDSSPITAEEIREACGDVGRKMTGKIEPQENKLVFMGIDYGLKNALESMANPEKTKGQGQSYSTAVILKVNGPGLLSVEYATKFHRNDFESKKSLIEQMMRQYSINLTVGDIGFSQEFSETMHKMHGLKYIVSRATGSLNGKVKFQESGMPPEIQFERDFYIGELYELMKKGQIRFPYGSYDRIGWLIQHCSSMDIKPSLSKYGDHSIHYVKNGPNDGFMALLNAYLAYKFHISNAFKEKNSLLISNAEQDAVAIPVVGGYIKRRM